jgi:lipopolysaccharide biosynthesis protein
MSRDGIDLRPMSGAVWRASDDASPVLVQEASRAVLGWTPDRATLRALAEIRTLRIELGLAALDGKAPDVFVEADWGGGYGAESRARLKTGGEALFTVLPAKGRRLRGLRLVLDGGAGRLRLEHFTVSGAGKLDPDPRGRLGPAFEALKGLLGPLRSPLAGAWRAARRARPAGRAPSEGAGDGWRRTYDHALAVARNARAEQFAAPIVEPLRLAADAPRILAFYLPQFHPIPENDAWWGKGFTDWSNVAKAQPQFVGHYQPRLPADLGYYDLRLPSVMAQQIALARSAGVSAFCFHYYWFDGKRLLETPIEAYLADPTLDLPFALCWANENWTRRWEGDEGQVLIAQNHAPEDDLAVFRDLARYMADPRYVRIGGRPVLVVYRPELLPDPKATAARWRGLARDLGLGELALYATTAFGFSDYGSHGFDGVVDFPPHGIDVAEITRQVQPLHPDFRGQVYDYARVVDAKLKALSDAGPGFVPGVMPSWDNQARKPAAGKVFHGAEPQAYQRWLAGALDHAVRAQPPGEALVFVNAWNEWAEGAYLEPDRWFGHAYLHATRAALAPYVQRLPADHPLVAASAEGFRRRSEAAILLHLYYPELTDWFATRLSHLAGAADIILTAPESWTEADLVAARAAFPDALLLITPNQGRDIGPFIRALGAARDHGHTLFCKLHTKRSPHRGDGDAWRETLVADLVGPGAAERALAAFARDPRLGLLAASDARMTLGAQGVMDNNRAQVQRLSDLMGLTVKDGTPFVAGSMFWGRIEAFEPLMALGEERIGFEPEQGRVDGAAAHALERLTAAIVARAGYRASFDL